jgi:oligopeptide transport system substrate-binding protein
MRPAKVIASCLLLAVVLLGACGPTTMPGPTAIPESTRGATSPPGGTPTGDYPPLPTVTPYAPPTAEPGTFSSPDYGVSLRYPAGWSATEGDTSQGIVAEFYSPDGSVIALLVASPIPADEPLENLAGEIRDAILSGTVDIQVLSDQAIQLDDGRPAWMTVATCTLPDSGEQLKVGMVSAIQGAGIFTLLAFGAPADYEANQSSTHALAAALHLEAPSFYGIPRDQSLVLSGGESTNPREYDPATTHGSGDKMVFSGLVSFDPQLHLMPELAESWQVAGGTVYTFTLRGNARFHNGRPVTAQDVIYSWERAADPATGSDTVLTYLGDIVGVKEMNAGQAEHISGLKAIDEHTLQVTIDAPKPYFLLKLTYPTAFVVDRANVQSGPEWYRTPNGTGPYRLTRWQPMQVKLYERNDDYYLDPPAIRYVIVQIYSGVGIRLYESGEIDLTGVGLSDVPRMLDPNEPLHTELQSAVDLCTDYVVFDVGQAPFDDPKVRQAFSMAVNRQQLIDVVYYGIGLPAEGLFPPALPGYNADLKGLTYDPARARQLLAESRYGGPQGLPLIVYTDSGEGGAVNSYTAALAQMWQQALGVTITVENLEPDRYLDELYAGRHGQMFGLTWCADYPDPENFADVLFHTGSTQNNGHYSNPQLDALLEQARVEQNVSRRIQLYQQAEQLIVNDAPVIFIAHGISYVLVKPYVQGYALTPVDIPLERYLWLDPTKMSR